MSRNTGIHSTPIIGEFYARTNLERILSRETLLAVAAWKRLDGKVYSLVSLEVVVAIETLRALVALIRPLLWRRPTVPVGRVHVVLMRHAGVVMMGVPLEAGHATHHG